MRINPKLLLTVCGAAVALLLLMLATSTTTGDSRHKGGSSSGSLWRALLAQPENKRSPEETVLAEKIEILTHLLAAKDEELEALRALHNKSTSLLQLLNTNKELLEERNKPPVVPSVAQAPTEPPQPRVIYQDCLNPAVNHTKSLWKKGNIVMFKTHKTGSTTLGSVLFRFGARHGRKFLMGKTHYTVPRTDRLKFVQEGGNIHLSHHITDGMTFQELTAFYASAIPNPTFVSVLRSPRSRYLSAYNYFWEPYHRNKFSGFLGDKRYMNQQCADFGLRNKTLLMEFLAPGGDFHKFGPMIITEKFDESLILLKRHFSWDLEDILYIRLLDACSGLRNYSGKLVKCDKPPESELPEFQDKINANNELDHILYDAFLERHQRLIKEQDSSFAAELEQFQAMKEALSVKCKDDAERFARNRAEYMKKVSWCTQYVIDDLGYEDLMRQGNGVVQWLLAESNIELY